MAYVLSSVSGNLISAASAGFAPTNSADVSAIASAYQVVSATATQLYAGTAYVTSVNDTPVSASRAGQAANASMANSAYYDGTGRLISALPDEAAVSAIASAYAESAASSKQDTLTFGYDAEDKISSIDGSAIAGGNEIVTSLETASSIGGLFVTATSVTGINGFDLSAKSAEWAKSAAYWTGASSKLDASASSKFVQTANIETQYGYVTAIKGTGLMGCDTAVFINSGSSFGFADANTPTALPDGTHTVTASKSIFTTPTITVREVGQSTGKTVYPASMATTARITGISALNPPLEIVSTTDISFTAAYANYASAQLAHASALPTYQYDAEDKISSINGSAIAVGAAGVDSATCSAIASAYAESAASGKLDSSASSSFYGIDNPSGFLTAAYTPTFGYNTADQISSIDGSAIAGGEQVVTSLQYTTSQSGAIVGSTTGDKAGYGNKVFSARYYPDQGWYNYQSATALAAVRFTSWDSNITGYTEYPFEIFMIPYGAANYGNIDYISSVGSYMNDYGQFNDTSDFRIATGMAMLSGNSAILDFSVTSLLFNTQYGPPMWGTAGGMVLDDSENNKPVFSLVYGSGNYSEGRCVPITDGPKALAFGAITTVSAVSGINELGIAGGAGGGIDSATCSAIASAYAESAVSSVSGNYYTTANESGYALSSDVSATVDIVSTQSANWGGSALALSAGPGVKLEKVGDTLVASTDETVLFSGSNAGMVATNLSEPLSGFNSFKICFNPFGGGMSREWKEFSWAGSSDVYTVATFHKNGNDNLAWYAAFQPNTEGTILTPIANKLWILGSTTVQDRTQMTVYRVVGINRTAEA